MSTCGQQSPDLVDWDRNLGKKWYQISSKKLSPFLVGHLLDFWPHNNNLPFVPQGFEKLHRSSPLRLIARDIGKKLFYRVLGNVTQKKKSPYGDLCNITITFGRPDCSTQTCLFWVHKFHYYITHDKFYSVDSQFDHGKTWPKEICSSLS